MVRRRGHAVRDRNPVGTQNVVEQREQQGAALQEQPQTVLHVQRERWSCQFDCQPRGMSEGHPAACADVGLQRYQHR